MFIINSQCAVRHVAYVYRKQSSKQVITYNSLSQTPLLSCRVRNISHHLMSLVLKIKTPKSNDKVLVHSITIVNKRNTRRRILVKIRLPGKFLRRINEGDDNTLSLLEQELNEALKAQDTPKADEINVTNAPSLNVTLNISPKKISKDDSLMSIDKLCNEQDSPLTSPVLQSRGQPHHISLTNKAISLPPIGTDSDVFRKIPPNLKQMLKEEFGSHQDEDFSIIEKMIFSLRDPLSASKIKLPVKSLMCTHFECFDFDNFCTFNRIPSGVSHVLRKDLYKKAYEVKKRFKQLEETALESETLKSMNMFLFKKNFTYQPNVNELKNFVSFPSYYPVYKCPICNLLFELNQLFISDIFNYFIKTTPLHIDRIEMYDMEKYRIVDETIHPEKKTETEEVVVLSDDEIDTRDSVNDDIKLNEMQDGQAPQKGNFDNLLLIYNQPEVNYGLDEETEEEDRTQFQKPVILQENQSGGCGSWSDPVTID